MTSLDNFSFLSVLSSLWKCFVSLPQIPAGWFLKSSWFTLSCRPFVRSWWTESAFHFCPESLEKESLGICARRFWKQYSSRYFSVLSTFVKVRTVDRGGWWYTLEYWMLFWVSPAAYWIFLICLLFRSLRKIKWKQWNWPHGGLYIVLVLYIRVHLQCDWLLRHPASI